MKALVPARQGTNSKLINVGQSQAKTQEYRDISLLLDNVLFLLFSAWHDIICDYYYYFLNKFVLLYYCMMADYFRIKGTHL
jgi:hypothetical protein